LGEMEKIGEIGKIGKMDSFTLLPSASCLLPPAFCLLPFFHPSSFILHP
jgi:hypothetical protein